jgi:hypothetical protein
MTIPWWDQKHWVVCKKHEKIEKVTSSQDDDSVGVLTKSTLNDCKYAHFPQATYRAYRALLFAKTP